MRSDANRRSVSTVRRLTWLSAQMPTARSAVRNGPSVALVTLPRQSPSACGEELRRIQEGQKLLINGAGGGVGTLGVQIAKLYGAETTGVDSGAKLDMLRSVGFDHVIDYEREDFTKNGQQYDLILDTKTNRSPWRYVRSLRPNGAYVTVGGQPRRLLQVLLLGPLISWFSKKRMRIVALKPNKDLNRVNELFQAGKLKCVLDGPFDLRDVPEAIQLFGAGRHKGKVVISVASPQQQ